MVTYSMSSANYALVLANRPFPSLLFHQILLFLLDLRIWLFVLKKVSLQNLKLIVLGIFGIFDLECHGQPSVKVELIMFGLVFTKFRKLRSLYRENKNLDLHKT